MPYLLILSKYSVWWVGTALVRGMDDAVPLFAILFAFGLD